MSGCTAPCMTQTTLKDGSGTPLDDQTSSVFYDYSNDIAWVGGVDGWLHKITGVFKGTPTEVTTGGFPVQMNPVTRIRCRARFMIASPIASLWRILAAFCIA